MSIHVIQNFIKKKKNNDFQISIFACQGIVMLYVTPLAGIPGRLFRDFNVIILYYKPLLLNAGSVILSVVQEYYSDLKGLYLNKYNCPQSSCRKLSTINILLQENEYA